MFAAAKLPIAWETVDVKPVPIEGQPGKFEIPKTALDIIRKNKIGLKGPLATPIAGGYTSLNLLLRKTFNLYANVRPCRSIPGFQTLYDEVDTIVIRENTEGEYSGIEHEVVKGVVQSIKLITREASERIADYAFQYARMCGRKHVSVIHKATIMYNSFLFQCNRRAADGLFLDAVSDIAVRYPDVAWIDVSLDKACLQVPNFN